MYKRGHLGRGNGNARQAMMAANTAALAIAFAIHIITRSNRTRLFGVLYNVSLILSMVILLFVL